MPPQNEMNGTNRKGRGVVFKLISDYAACKRKYGEVCLLRVIVLLGTPRTHEKGQSQRTRLFQGRLQERTSGSQPRIESFVCEKAERPLTLRGLSFSVPHLWETALRIEFSVGQAWPIHNEIARPVSGRAGSLLHFAEVNVEGVILGLDLELFGESNRSRCGVVAPEGRHDRHLIFPLGSAIGLVFIPEGFDGVAPI